MEEIRKVSCLTCGQNQEIDKNCSSCQTDNKNGYNINMEKLQDHLQIHKKVTSTAVDKEEVSPTFVLYMDPGGVHTAPPPPLKKSPP
jgi:hypothetical protein